MSRAAATFKRAREAAGGVPIDDAPKLKITKITEEWYTKELAPQDFVIDPLLPAGCCSVLNSEGGGGKSAYVLGAANSIVRRVEKFHGLEVRGGPVLIVSAEDPIDVVRRRLFAQYKRLVRRLTGRVNRGDMTAAEMTRITKEYRERESGDLHLMFIREQPLHLITMEGGVVTQSPGLAALIAKAKKIKGLRLIIIDPLARLHGCQENGNEVFSALITAGESIANATGAAVLVLHHVSKEASRTREISAAASRGGSALTDGARSVMRLAPVDKLPKNKVLKYVAEDGTVMPVTQEHCDDGRVVVLAHVKSNYTKRHPDLYALRDADSAMLSPLRVDVVDGSDYRYRLESLREWFKKRPVGFVLTKEKMRESYKEIDENLTRSAALELMSDAITNKDLIEAKGYKGKNKRAEGYVLASIPAKPPIPAKESAGIAKDVGRGAAAIPAAAPPPMAAAGISKGKKKKAGAVKRKDTRRYPPNSAGSKKGRKAVRK